MKDESRGWKRRWAKCCCQLICLEGHNASTKYSCKIRETEREGEKGQCESCISVQSRCLYSKICFLSTALHSSETPKWASSPEWILIIKKLSHHRYSHFHCYTFHALIWLPMCISSYQSASLHPSAPPRLHPSPSLSQSLHLYQDFLYFPTLLSLRSEWCLSNSSSRGFLPAAVAAAVLKQVLDAIWPASVLC